MKPLEAKRLTGLAAALLVTAIVGCAGAPANMPVELNPRSLAELERSTPSRTAEARRPTVALGGGGLRGFAHLGVLRAHSTKPASDPTSSSARRLVPSSVPPSPAG